MDKYEYRIKAEQIRKLAEQEDYVSAMKIANTIDWNRVRSIPMLCLVGEIYEKNDMLEESKEVMMIAYDRHPYGRMIIYSLAELSIRLEDYIDAVEYYKEFVQVAPRDTGRYILQYKLYEAQDVGIKERIAVLEEFKRHEYIEKWAFELAYLYHRAGMNEKCVAECDEIILWFSEGKYVEKAMELKMLYQPLTEEQQKKYDSRNDVQIEKSIAAVEAVAERSKEEEADINVKPLNCGIYDTVNLQKELAKSMQQILEATEKEDVDSTMDNIKQLVKESKIEGLVEEPVGRQTKEIEIPEEEEEENILNDAEVVAEAAKLMGQLTSVNKRETVEETEEVEEKSVESPVSKETEEELEKTKEFIIHIADAPTKIIPTKEIEKELQKELQKKDSENVVEEPKDYERILSEELDGQISMCVPDQDVVEKQITGQMSIEEVLIEWERIKAEAEEEKKKSLEEARAKAVAETEDIMDRLADVVPSISEEMKKMMNDREEELSESVNSAEREAGLKNILDEECVFEKPEETKEEKQLEELMKPPVKVQIESSMEEPVKEEETPMEEPVREEETPIEEPVREEEIPIEEPVREEEIPMEEPVREEEIPMEESTEEDFRENVDEKLQNSFTLEFGDLEEAIAKEAEAALKAIDEAENAWEEPKNELDESEEIAEEELEIETPEELSVWANEEETSDNIPIEEEINVKTDIEVAEEIDMEKAVLESFAYQEEQEELDELDEFGKEEEPDDEDAVEELESKLTAKLPEGIISIAGEEEEEITEPLEVGAEAFKRIFKYFTEIEGVSDQIVDALEVIDGISDKGNLVIMGDTATGKTTLAIDIIKAAKKSRNIIGNKIAKITGEAMNNKEMASIMESAAGGVLLIEGAAEMNADTVNRLSEAMDESQDNLLVIIEDVKERMLKLLERNKAFRSKFPARIDLPPYTNGDLVAFAKSYALERECKIDDMGILALYSRLAEVQFETEVTPSLADVKGMVDSAIEQANKKNLKNMFANLVAKKYDTEHYLILKEKDFV